MLIDWNARPSRRIKIRWSHVCIDAAVQSAMDRFELALFNAPRFRNSRARPWFEHRNDPLRLHVTYVQS